MKREHKVVDKLWGREIWFENNDLYCGKEIICTNMIWSSEGDYHYHPIKDETFYIIEGTLELEHEGTVYHLEEGDSIRVRPKERHRFRSVGAICRFIEVSTHHSDEDSIRVKYE